MNSRTTPNKDAAADADRLGLHSLAFCPRRCAWSLASQLMSEHPQGTGPALTNFPLLWRWTRETHAKLPPDELESIRPLVEHEAAALCDQVVRELAQRKPEERLQVGDESDDTAVARWLDNVIPNGANELLLIWDRRTAASVPRALFVRRWDDFWYPSSDDLSVIGTDGRWHLEMRHDGLFEFSNSAG